MTGTCPSAQEGRGRTAAERMQQELGGANILVNVGVMLTAPFASDQREEHRRMVETNLLGAMTATEVFLAQLRANGGGDLVNVSSVAGRVAPAGFAAYAATKWLSEQAGFRPLFAWLEAAAPLVQVDGRHGAHQPKPLEQAHQDEDQARVRSARLDRDSAV